MAKSIRGGLAAAVSCALLVACGGGSGSDPTPLPASVDIASDARAETGAATHFSSSLAATSGVIFHWDFGDGATSTDAAPDHAYAKAGTYQVTLAVTNTAADRRTSSASIQVAAYANVAGLACTQADSAGWCWQHALATGHAINDVFFTDATHAVAVGDGLAVLKSADGGETWTPVALAADLPAASLRSVRFYDALHGMALTDHDWALQTSDGGSTWTANSLGGMAYGDVFADYSATRIVLQQSSYYTNAIVSTDGGATWSAIDMVAVTATTATDCWGIVSTIIQKAAGCGRTTTTSLTVPGATSDGAQFLLAGSFLSSTQGMALGWSYASATSTYGLQAWQTTDGGASWTSAAATGLPDPWRYYTQALRMIDAQTAISYQTEDIGAYVTHDGGVSWTAITSAPAVAQATDGYRATGFIGSTMWQSVGSHLAISVDLGQTWQAADVRDEDGAVPSIALAVTQYTDAASYVVSISHRYYVTRDGGQTFTRILGPDSRDAGSASAAGFFFDAKNGKFLSARGALLSTADGGRTWTRVDSPTNTGVAVALHFNSATDGWMILDGKLAHTTDGGTSWSTPSASAAMADLRGMSWGDATHAWTWNQDGSVFATADGGVSWTTLALPGDATACCGAMTGARTGVLSMAGGGYQVTGDGGATWQSVPGSADGNRRLVHATGRTVWSMAGRGSRSRDGGLTWAEVGPVGHVATDVSFADESHGWLITDDGGVFVTVDGGDTWSGQPVGSGLSLQAVVAVDTMTAWIMTNDGQVLATATAGN